MQTLHFCLVAFPCTTVSLDVYLGLCHKPCQGPKYPFGIAS